MSDSILLSLARDQAAAFASGTIKSQWDYFEYGVKLALARWTALRMAMEGEWGGGDTRRKYEILLEEILTVYKYNKVVHTDAMGDNIGDYVEAEFGLVCEDGSVHEVAALLTALADECKTGSYARVQSLHEQVQKLIPIDLKQSKVRRDETNTAMASGEGGAPLDAVAEEGQGMEDDDATLVDEDGFVTVRRSTRRKNAPKIFDPSVEFPGAQ